MAYQCPEPDTMTEVALTLNEYYQELLKSGFSKHEALHILLAQACCPLTEE